jgi:hypothetical protein
MARDIPQFRELSRVSSFRRSGEREVVAEIKDVS